MSYFEELEKLKTPKSINRKEHAERSKKNFDFKPLRDGEEKTFFLPAFDFRDTEDSNYGQHSVELIFAKRRGNKVVTVEFYTGWSVQGGGIDIPNNGMMCLGLYTHYHFKKDGIHDHEYKDSIYANDGCPYWGKRCYGYMGSSLYGDVILNRLINEGSYGVWDEINKELEQQDENS